MISVLDIAKYIYDKGYATDNIKLNKLMYIAFGFYGATYQKYLFSNVIEAWEYGPVIPRIYYDYKIGKLPNRPSVKLPQAMQVCIDKVLSLYGDKAPFLLVELTHQDNTPWSNTYIKGQKSVEIPKENIINYYTSFLSHVDQVLKVLNTEDMKRVMVELAKT